MTGERDTEREPAGNEDADAEVRDTGGLDSDAPDADEPTVDAHLSPTSAIPAVGAVVLDGAGDVLVVYDRHHGSWTLPLGRLDPGESVAACVRREVREEADVAVTVERLAGVYSDPSTQVYRHRSGDVVHMVTTLVVCAVAEDDPDPAGDGVETGDARFVAPADLPEMPPLDGWVREALADEDPVLA